MVKTTDIPDEENPFRSPEVVAVSQSVSAEAEDQEPTSFVIRAVVFVIALLSLLYFVAFLSVAVRHLLNQNVAFGFRGLATCGLSLIAALASVVLLISTVRDQRWRGFQAAVVWLFAVACITAAQYVL
ncbi:MAG: hypothetical protein ABGZ53_10545 [Fuerstiella sp.]|nr:hypothetical protein [Fuerstiella sp.]